MASILQLNEFFVEGDKQELSHVLLHIIQPSTPEEEKKKGYFFVICEINKGDKNDVFNLQTLMDSIENDYYEIPDTAETNALENILEKINQENFILSSDESELNCLVGTLKGNELTFSFCGTPEAVLFYKNKLGQYKKMDLVAANENENEEDKLFSQIIQGIISDGDYFFAGTAHIANCFNHDRLQKIITGRTTEQSAEHIKKVLSNIKNGYSYGGLIVHFTPKFNEPVVRTQDEARSNLYDTETQTARTLSPSLMENLNTKVKAIIGAKHNDEDEEENQRPATVPANKNIVLSSTVEPVHPESSHTHLKQRQSSSASNDQVTQLLKIIFQAIWKGLKYAGLGIYWFFFALAKIVVNIGRFFIMLFIIIINYKNRRRSILESWAESRRRFFQSIKNLPLLTKILAIASIIFLIIFIISIFYLQTQKNAAEANRIYEEEFQLIKNKIDAAESAMIYGDESGAKNQMMEAREYINLFACRPIDEGICNDIQSRVSELALKLQKMDTVKLDLIVDWGSLGFSNIQKIIKLDTKIIGFSPNSNSLLIYDFLTKQNSVVSPTENTIGGFIAGAVPKEDDYAAFVASDNKTLAIYDPKNDSFKKAQISYSSAEANIKAIVVYNRRLYALDSATNQIYRHDNIIGGFGVGKDWLQTSGINIRDGISLAIDGDLFVLKSNGIIYKFNQGSEQMFELESIDPILDGGNEFWTYTDLKNLYLLDAKNKRLVIYDKTGKLIRQITGNELSNPTGMVIEETKSIGFFLDSDKVYQFNLK
jgi:hypothetical protein